jgi:tRNA A-37 threonylcarbamoyl transferase component Bud32
LKHEELVGRTIAGKFAIESIVGSGAMGVVYRAKQLSLDKTVAIKVLNVEHKDDPSFAARFQREAKAASRLNHPNSMQVIDHGEDQGLLYIAMEYLDGRNLLGVIRDDAPLAPGRVADLLMQTLAALAVAHEMGIVHRDLKPENIMVLSRRDDDGRPRDVVKVCDFGIAKITDPRAYKGDGERESVAPVTTAGFLVGTPEYMSPEQGRGEKVDPRSDIYSVGVILYQLLTSRLPFEAESAIGVVLKHVTEAPAPPSSQHPFVDPKLEAICLRALEKRPEDRFASAREMRAELRVVAETGGMPVATESRSGRVVRTVPDPAAHAATVVATPVVGALGVPDVSMREIPGLATRRRGLVMALLLALGLCATLVVVGVTGSRSHATSAGEPSGGASSSDTTQQPLMALAEDSARVASPPGSHLTKGKTGVLPPALLASAARAPASPSAGAEPPSPASTSAAASAPPPPDTASESPVDVENAYVEIGIVNTTNVRERAVRAGLQTLVLGECYRSALRSSGARIEGVGELDLSFGDDGTVRTAVLTGVPAPAGMKRCIQNRAGGMHVSDRAVEGPSPLASATLVFHLPRR